jgi:hypothetical protein
MSQELFVAVAQSNIRKVKKAIESIQKLREDNSGLDFNINSEIIPKQTILDIATQEASEHSNLPQHPSNEVVILLRNAGAILFSEIPVDPVDSAEEEEEENFNGILGGENLVRVSPAPPSAPKPPVHPTSKSSTIANGIASLRRRGGRKTKQLRIKKTKKSRKHLRR